MPGSTQPTLSALKTGLTLLYGERLRGLRLSGACARGETRPNSDPGILVA